jgi:hypothetical protein
LPQLGFCNFFVQFVLMIACLFLLSGCGGKIGNLSEAERQRPAAAGTPDAGLERRIAVVNDVALDRWTDDLGEMIERGKIRALVVYSESAFFYNKANREAFRARRCASWRQSSTRSSKPEAAACRLRSSRLPPKTWSERCRNAVDSRGNRRDAGAAAACGLYLSARHRRAASHCDWRERSESRESGRLKRPAGLR